MGRWIQAAGLLIWAVSGVTWGAIRLVPEQYATIQTAVDVAAEGDVIVVAPGTYGGDGNHDIKVAKPVTIRSVNPGDPCTVTATIIDCRGQGRAFLFERTNGAQAILAGLTITGGLAKDGSGIAILQSSPTITGCRIIANGSPEAAVNGAGIYLRDSFAALSYCVIADNRAQDHGGGVYCYSSSPRITNCAIVNNRVQNEGGGIAITQESNPTIARSTITDNLVTVRRGGGIACRGSDCRITNCIIARNRSGRGDGGGGLWLQRSLAVIENCTITGNINEYAGGGIFMDLCDVAIEDSILWGNSSRQGNEIAVHSWQGLYEGVAPAPTLTPVANSFLDISYSDVQGGQHAIYVFDVPEWFQGVWGQGNLNTDPLFADPNSDYHLKSQVGRWDPAQKTWVIDDVTSPCIDAGDPGRSVQNEPVPNGDIISIGAYGGTTEASKSYLIAPAPAAIGAGSLRRNR